MSDKKISALTAATTPLAGTEVLPIVQSGVTVKVTNNDLRPKQIQSNATSGVLQVAGPATATTRVMTTPDANFTVARTDAAQSFSGTQTFRNSIGSGLISTFVSDWSNTKAKLQGSGVTGAAIFNISNDAESVGFGFEVQANGVKTFSCDTAGNLTPVGNLVIGTSGKGIDFSATPGTGTSELLADYEEGTWTVTRNGFTETLNGGTITSTGTYTKIGRQVFVTAIITPAGGATIAATSGTTSNLSGLPYVPSVKSNGTWVDTGSVAASGNLYVNTDSVMYLTQGFGTSAASFVFAATYIA